MDGWLAIIGFAAAGEGVAHLLGLPVPGPVIGLALFLGALALRPGLARLSRDGAESLLRHLPLMLVPLAAGALAEGLLGGARPGLAAFLVALVAIQAAALAAVGLAAQRIMAGRRRPSPLE
ncbi:MAG TPA: CidA/LrgA family protein [Alphaproteobacteria bacterium]|nr:CidA/LrgA family protein [Alphaproteobacteria bacterium]